MARAVTSTDIFLYIPNLIGYTRVILACGAIYYMQWHPKYCTILYCLSCLLDALDGAAARRFNQSSSFGAILDMVTDRCTTASLTCYLCIAYPRLAPAFQSLVALDLASHYMHMYATLTTSDSNSHKKVSEEESWILNLYYSNRIVLFVVCAVNELFYVGLYLYSVPLKTPPYLGYYGDIPLSYATILTALTFPLWAFKQFLNGVQLYRAAINLAESDADNVNGVNKSKKSQ